MSGKVSWSADKLRSNVEKAIPDLLGPAAGIYHILPLSLSGFNVYYQSILDYLPASWTLFEMGALNIYQFIPHDPMAAYGPNHGACIIPPPNGNWQGGKITRQKLKYSSYGRDDGL
jgi:hypothetical protein